MYICGVIEKQWEGSLYVWNPAFFFVLNDPQFIKMA